jgi:hypothetical protein
MKKQEKELLIKVINQVLKSKKSSIHSSDKEKLIVVREGIKHSKTKMELLNWVAKFGLLVAGSLDDVSDIAGDIISAIKDLT